MAESMTVQSLLACLQGPADVDFKIMATFLEFYTTLLGFVNYRLYTDLGLIYPPKVTVSFDWRPKHPSLSPSHRSSRLQQHRLCQHSVRKMNSQTRFV